MKKKIKKLFALSFFILNFIGQNNKVIAEDTLTAILLKEAVEDINSIFKHVKAVGGFTPPCQSSQLIIPQNITLIREFTLKGVNEKCFDFIEKNGEMGKWGKIIINTINERSTEDKNKTFFSNNIPDMNFICPKFKLFPDNLKMKFYVWVFASISFDESSCNEFTKDGPGEQKKLTAQGLLQLESLRSLRKGRGGHCNVDNIKLPENNLSCGVDILHEILKGKDSLYYNGKSTGELFWKGSYWAKIRLKAKNNKKLEEKKQQLVASMEIDDDKIQLKELIMKFPSCR